MLEYLRIRNLALIEDMALEFSPGMNVLTGETGAGKSFVLKALGFLLGESLQGGMVRPGAQKAEVDAVFNTKEGELVLRRELAAETGRSRFFVNDSLASKERLRDLRADLVTLTSQHAQQQLLQPSFQARLIDQALPDPALLQRREAALADLQRIAQARAELEGKRADLLKDRELLEMQQTEIDKVKPKEGEEEELETLRTQAKEGEHLQRSYGDALDLLYGREGPGILDLLAQFVGVLRPLAEGDEAIAEDASETSRLRERLQTLGGRLKRPPAAMSRAQMDKIEERLFALSQLKRKLRRTIPQILELREEIAANLSFLDVCALDISQLKREEAEAAKGLAAVIGELGPARREAAARFVARLETELRDLGFAQEVRVIPDFTPHEIWPGVSEERVRLLWAPNPGQPPQPLDRIASGGELSRFLLALVTVRSEADDATYVFDEVDAGVGGYVLNKLADKLRSLAGRRQMLLITHWPQLAVHAGRHFQISKEVRQDETFTLCRPLEGEERREELARMAGGGLHGEALARSLEETGGG
ncbi:MAG: AAA family ATPase [Desulfovibrio sp.]|jgi:DNA repair protein RecN (Recombination protein N)|nr:AAA family ATPase [Desulfovibrio sp.]